MSRTLYTQNFNIIISYEHKSLSLLNVILVIYYSTFFQGNCQSLLLFFFILRFLKSETFLFLSLFHNALIVNHWTAIPATIAIIFCGNFDSANDYLH